MRSVLIRNTTFHLHTNEGYNSFKYIIDYYRERSHKKEKEQKDGTEPFVVDIKDVVLDNVCYRMTLDTIPYYANRNHGVDVANMEMDSICAHITNLHVVDDHIKCHIVKMSTVERSGWKMKKLAGDVDVSGKGIHVTDMQLHTCGMNMLSDVHLVYDNWNSLDWYCDSVYMDVTFKKGNMLSMIDAAYWAPSLWGCDNNVYIEGHVTGPVSNLRVENFNINFGRKTHLYFDGTVCGLPYIEGTFFDIHLHQLRTDISDLLDIHHPGTLNIGNTKIYEELGTIDLVADLVGGADKCFANLDLRTALGNISSFANIERMGNLKRTKSNITIGSERIELPSLAKNDWVSHTGFDIEITANGTNLDDLKAELQAELHNTSLVGNDIDRATLAASLTNRLCDFDIQIKDTVLDMTTTGNIAFPKKGDQRYSIDIDLTRADLKRLGLVKCDSLCTLSTHIQTDIRSNAYSDHESTFSNPSGFAWISNTVLKRDEKKLTLDNANITASEENQKKKVTLVSDIANITAKGYFDYSDIPLIVKKFRNDYTPTYWQQHLDKPNDIEMMDIVDADIDLNIRWRDRRKQIHFFLPNLDIADGTTVSATYNHTESLKMVLRADSVKYGSVGLHSIGITTKSIGERYSLAADISELTMNGEGAIDDLRLNVSTGHEGIGIATQWEPAIGAINTRADIALEMYSEPGDNTLTVIKPFFHINGEQWTLQKHGEIKFNKSRITANDIELSSGDQSMIIGYQQTADHSNDNAHARFTNVKLSTISDLLTKDKGFDASGNVNGTADVVWVKGTSAPLVKSNLSIDSCLLNRHQLGNINLNVNHDIKKKRTHLFVKTELVKDYDIIHPIQASGYADFSGDEPILDLSAEFESFDLITISPLLKSFASRFEGLLSGDIAVHGTLKDPKIAGTAWVKNGLINIDATNVAYLFDDTISLSSNRVELTSFKVRDIHGNTANITGNIDYHGLSDFSANIQLATRRLLVYDNNDANAMGTIYAAMTANVRGPFSALDINANARTLEGSKLTIPVTSQRNIKNSDFITFVCDDDYLRNEEPSIDKKKRNTSNTININLTLTPDLKLQIPMDMSPVSLDIRGNGNGSLAVSIQPQKDIQMVGDYRITEGNIKLDLLSLATRDFKIEEESSIIFPGNFSEATLDVNAIYSQRVDLNSILSESENTVAQKPVPVESVVSLSGKLNSPNISFDIRLPNADQSLQDEVFAAIDRTNEREMLNQTLYLLINGKFYSNQTNTSNDNTSLAANGISAVANSLGSVVSSMIEFVDINFDYTAATSTRAQQYSVGINKQWNKFYLESTLGYGGYDRELSSNEALANNIVGDVLIGYKFNPNLHLFMFNRSNTNDYTRFEMPYKQGVGVKYTRDFDKWKDLFKRKNRKRKSTSR